MIQKRRPDNVDVSRRGVESRRRARHDLGVSDDFDTPKRSASHLIVAALLVALVAGGGYLFVQATTVTFDPAPLLEAGLDERAEILSAQPTGREYEGQAIFELELQVSDEGRGYRVFHQQPFAKSEHDKLVKTTLVEVKVDPQDAKKLWVTKVDVSDSAP